MAFRIDDARAVSQPHYGSGSDGFPASGFADYRKRLALVQIKADAADCLHDSGRGAEADFQVLNLKEYRVLTHGSSLPFFGTRIQRIAQSIAKQIEGQHDDAQHQAREDQLPWIELHLRLAIGNQHA